MTPAGIAWCALYVAGVVFLVPGVLQAVREDPPPPRASRVLAAAFLTLCVLLWPVLLVFGVARRWWR